ncbi:hypothetical protein H8E88_21220 [candidate division KSB1 bacterium]|nr:hypothetical protein [candidate division KSB1 bacterium]MBL7095602.1 hypothetical protein [candidate division KSB1 bacterium]
MSELVVDLYSFGYQFSGIPEDLTDNKGGFVFDCRFLPNPGRQPAYFELTGMDREVEEYLEQFPQLYQFLNNIISIVDMAISNYKQREFTHLMISFGCTGGQHRSVYCAERLNVYLLKTGVKVNLNHVEQDK